MVWSSHALINSFESVSIRFNWIRLLDKRDERKLKIGQLVY